MCFGECSRSGNLVQHVVAKNVWGLPALFKRLDRGGRQFAGGVHQGFYVFEKFQARRFFGRLGKKNHGKRFARKVQKAECDVSCGRHQYLRFTVFYK